MKLLTFLGVARYNETEYVWNHERRKTRYSPAATASMLHVDSVTVFLTKEAEDTQFADFRKCLPDCVTKVQKVPVQTGKDQNEFWANFSVLCNAVTPDETVAFDITHGFRSLPLLALLAVAFLRASQRVNIQHVLYGAYDSKSPELTPIFDLSPMLALLDWANATTRFVKTGDARDLAGLLNNSANGSQVVANAATLVQDVSLAAFLCQPLTLGPKSSSLIQTLSDAEPAIKLEVPPFGFLNKRIADDFGTFESDHTKDVRQALQAQLRLIRWYHDNNQLIQAMSLTREWLINAVAYKLGMGMPLNRDDREKKIRPIITELSKFNANPPTPNQLPQQKATSETTNFKSTAKMIYDTWDESLWKRIVSVWDSSTPVRNTLDHAGYQDDPVAISEIVKIAENAIQDLDAIAKGIGIQ